MKFTILSLIFLSILCAKEIDVDSLIALKSEGKLVELEQSAEILVADSTLSSEQVELPLFYLIETKAKLNKMKALPPLMKRFITNYPNSDSLSRVYYIAAIYSAKRKNYVPAIKACDRGLSVVLSSDTTTRSLLLKTCTKLVERVYDLKKIDDALAFSTADALKNLLLARQEVLKEKATHPMAGYPDGRYVSFQDFKEKKAVPTPNVIVQKNVDKYRKYRGMEEFIGNGVYVVSSGFGGIPKAVKTIPDYNPFYWLKINDDGYVRKWDEKTDGAIYVIVVNGRAAIPRASKLQYITIFNNYSWYRDFKKGIMVLNMETGEVRGLSDKYLRELLKVKPELLKKYEDNKRKKISRLKFLESFLKETNPTYESYHPTN